MGQKNFKRTDRKSVDDLEKDNLIQFLFKVYDLRLKYYPGKEVCFSSKRKRHV